MSNYELMVYYVKIHFELKRSFASVTVVLVGAVVLSQFLAQVCKSKGKRPLRLVLHNKDGAMVRQVATDKLLEQTTLLIL